MKTTERLMKYVQIHTTSDDESPSTPSTPVQWDLARVLKEELEALGLEDVQLDEYCTVTATLPGVEGPTVGLFAHLDTSPALSGKGVRPRIVENYDGGDILLNPEKNIVLSPREFPELMEAKGLSLMVTDGTTLLGADDKAGIAAIMEVLDYFITTGEAHPTLKVCFSPDEEVGRGMEHFDVAAFGADFGYTVDGGRLGEVQYECFNATDGKVRFQGKSVHPGSAKGKMINALDLAMEFDRLLPAGQRPQFTEGYEGFYHLDRMEGSVDEAVSYYILRDFDGEQLEERKELFRSAAAFLEQKYQVEIDVELEDIYRNMREKIEPVMEIVDALSQSMEAEGIVPIMEPIRGGTDGSKLSQMGLPTPNLFTGGMNFHGKYEYIPLEHLELAVKVLIRTLKSFVA
ncbi:MAG: peptidase T [Tissierellia bacterium]|nr:peptidase T [Tissierellia bacterium]